MKDMNIIRYIVGVFSMLVVFFSCEKSGYIDSGTYPNNYDGTILQYLDSRPELFDSLMKVVKLADMEAVLNNDNITFFAPPDVTIEKSVRLLNQVLFIQGRDTVIDLAQVNPIVWKEYLSMYVFEERRSLKDYPQLDTLKMESFPGQGFIALGGQNMNIGVLYNDVVSKNNAGVEQRVKYAGYRQLYLSNFDFGIIHTPIATSDIRTRNGNLHVLNIKRHSFGFSSINFANRAFSLM